MKYALQRPTIARWGDAARDARPADSTNFDARSGAWTHHRPRHRTAFGGGLAGGTRLALSRASSIGRRRLDRVVLGNVRAQSQSALLPIDSLRTQAANTRNQSLGAFSRRGESRAAPGR